MKQINRHVVLLDASAFISELNRNLEAFGVNVCMEVQLAAIEYLLEETGLGLVLHKTLLGRRLEYPQFMVILEPILVYFWALFADVAPEWYVVEKIEIVDKEVWLCLATHSPSR